jgi:secondary thiamine-phosphate synthase enzyme
MLIQKELEITIDGKGLYNITEIINQAIAKHRIAKGLCTLFIKHTSASLIIQENADPNVLKDIIDFFDRVVPESENYAHKEEGPDDMPAHIKSALTIQALIYLSKKKSLIWEHGKEFLFLNIVIKTMILA